MRFEHPDLPGRDLRLAYCLNLHGADDFAGVLRGMRSITLPLRDRLAEGGRFGVGMYFPAAIAAHLDSAEGAADRSLLAEFLRDERLDPFTFNAFPYGGFHSAGLKKAVFTPTWFEEDRARYTLAVGRLAAELNAGSGGHVSISTHPGRFGPWEGDEFERSCARLEEVLRAFAAIEADGGPRLRLALEAEPRAVAGDMASLGALLSEIRQTLDPRLGSDLVSAHLGACLDTCHASVEFEDPSDAVTAVSVLPLGKVQVSSAISLLNPGSNALAREELFGLDEPRYLHQTTGRRGTEFVRAMDLPEVQTACADENSPWLQCDEWRTHFHVPIDLERLEGNGLETTRSHALDTLRELLARPESWGSPELHVEIETYTWDILPKSAGGGANLVDGLEREYGPVLECLKEAGWVRVSG
jgi:hypothetical protein